MDKVVDGKKHAKKQILNELKGLINDAFEDYYGFRRSESQPRDNIDLDVARHYMRYDCIFDTVSKKIYRR